MIITCSMLLVLFSLIFFILFICLSRRHLVGFLCSSLISLGMVIAIYFIFIYSNNLDNLYLAIYPILNKLNSEFLYIHTRSFVNSSLIIISYILIFVIVESIFAKIINQKDNNVILNKNYYLSKVILVISNLSIIIVFGSILFSNLNFIYDFEVGLFKSLFSLIKEGILLL